MKRRSFKYIFIFNCIVIGVMLILVFATQNTPKAYLPKHIAVISTPLIGVDTDTSDLCGGAVAAILIDAKSGAVLYEKNAHKQLPFASTTKIMTALAVIEKANPEDVIEVSSKAAGIHGSSIYLKAGEKISVLDLLYGLLLESGNDAATALAIGVFGSEEKCLEYMNMRCHSMGCVSTNFENVHGLDSDNHKTTAYELSLIASRAMQNPLFRKIVSTKSYTTTGENPRYFGNHNRLLSASCDFCGIKTGYTSNAGRCLVSCVTTENGEFIAVTLNDRNDWNDHKKMAEYAVENFCTYEIANKDSFDIRIGFDNYKASDSVFITSLKDVPFTVDYRIIIEKGAYKAEYSTENAPLGSFGLHKQIREPSQSPRQTQ